MKINLFRFHLRTFTTKRLSNLRKYAEFKFNFKNFINGLPMHISNINNRKVDADATLVANLYNDYTKKVDDINLMRRQLNAMKQNVAEFKIKSIDINHLMKDVKKHTDDIGKFQEQLAEIELKLMNEALRIPNITHPDVPVGCEENAKLIKLIGQKPNFSFKPLDHLAIGKKFDLFDFESAAKISGSKFVILKNQAAILELALTNWAIDFVRKRGYTFIITPDVSKNTLIEGCGFMPRDKNASQIYFLEPHHQTQTKNHLEFADPNHYEPCGLIATSEIACAGIYANEIIAKKELPKKYVCLSHCFRKEAGHGQHSKGLYRLHQFTKVEMFAFTEGSFEQSEAIHKEMLEIQEELYTLLGLHFRVLDMPTEELGAAAYRKFDIEAYLPSKGDFGEISSTSNCIDYQSLRLNCLYFDKNLEKKHMHTVNGTALAVPRILIAILENFQTQDGKVLIPEILHPFTFGMKVIE